MIYLFGRITNPHIHSGWIANPAEQELNTSSSTTSVTITAKKTHITS
ncbi:MAG: hypothetical protein IKJ98_05320 [Bacteroidales bacterium]|nr:hypothetical protein [Bacteroidales bacterium]